MATRTKDAENAKRLPAAPSWRRDPTKFPYHNNLGTNHASNKVIRADDTQEAR